MVWERCHALRLFTRSSRIDCAWCWRRLIHLIYICKDFYKKKLCFQDQMQNVPDEMLVFIGEDISSSILFKLFWPCCLTARLDESAICERNLMQVYGCLTAGKDVTWWTKHSNPKSCSMILAIGLNGLPALIGQDGTFNQERFENFLEFQLVYLIYLWVALGSRCWSRNAVTINESLSFPKQYPCHGQHTNPSWVTHWRALWGSRYESLIFPML